MKKHLVIDVWSDIVCPWCAIGKRRLEAALATFPHKDDVEIVWRAFELDPSSPAVQTGDNAARLAQKYGKTRAEAEGLMRQVADTAAKDGLDLKLLTAKSGNTFDAHRVLKLAEERGGHALQGKVKERLMRGYMTDGDAIGDRETLVRLAAEAGLDADAVRATLASDQYAREVRDEEETAQRLGIRGVPFFVLGGKYALSGAQPAEVMRKALEQAWASVPEVEAAAGEGAVCGPEGCA